MGLLTGTIKEVFETKVISDKFQKREFAVVEDADLYPQTILLQLTQDKCDMIDSYKVGDKINVNYNLRGRCIEKDGNNMYFNSLDAWKIDMFI